MVSTLDLVRPPHTEPRQKVGRYAWYVVAILLLISVLGYVDRLILSFLVEPIKAELRLSDTQVGLVTGFAFALLYVVAGLPIGRLIDTARRVNVLAACILVWSLATAACGLAGSFWTMMLARVGVGAGEAAVGPAAVSLIGDYFPSDRVQRPLGLFTVGLYVGGGAALIVGAQLETFLSSLGPIALPLVGAVSSWRMTFLLLGLPGIVTVLLLLATVREPRRMAIASDPGDRGGALAFARAHARLLSLLLASVVVWGMNGYGFINWYPAMLQRSYGMSPQAVAWGYGPAFLLGGTIGSLLLAPLVERLRRAGREDAVFVAAGIGMAGLTVAAAIGPVLPGRTGVLLCSFVAMLFQSMAVVAAYAIIAAVTPSALRGLYTGAYMAVMNITGGAFGAVVVGLLADHVTGARHINRALVIVALVFGPAAVALMALAAREFRRSPPGLQP